jgi:hypothetical protein
MKDCKIQEYNTEKTHIVQKRKEIRIKFWKQNLSQGGSNFFDILKMLLKIRTSQQVGSFPVSRNIVSFPKKTTMHGSNTFQEKY